MYSGRTENLIGPTLEAFACETGTDVAVRWGSSTDLAPADGRGGRPHIGRRLPVALARSGRVPRGAQACSAPSTATCSASSARRADRGRTPGSASRAASACLSTISTRCPPAELPESVFDLTGDRYRGPGRHPGHQRLLHRLVHRVPRPVRLRRGPRNGSTTWWPTTPATTPTTGPSSRPAGRGEIDMGLVNHYYQYQEGPRPRATATAPPTTTWPMTTIGSAAHHHRGHHHRRQREPAGRQRADRLPAVGAGSALLQPANLRIPAGGGGRAGRHPPSAEGAGDRQRRLRRPRGRLRGDHRHHRVERHPQPVVRVASSRGGGMLNR